MNKNLIAVLKRYNYKLEEIEGDWIMEKFNFQSSPVKLFYYLALFLVLTGVLLLVYGLMLFAIILLASAIPMFIKGSKMNSSEKNESIDKIQFNTDTIKIYKKLETVEFKISDIVKIEHGIIRDEDITTGKVDVNFENDESVNLLTIFGDDRRYVEDDSKLIADYIFKYLKLK